MLTRGFSAMRHAPVVGIDSSCIRSIHEFHLLKKRGFFTCDKQASYGNLHRTSTRYYLGRILNNVTFTVLKKVQ